MLLLWPLILLLRLILCLRLLLLARSRTNCYPVSSTAANETSACSSPALAWVPPLTESTDGVSLLLSLLRSLLITLLITLLVPLLCGHRSTVPLNHIDLPRKSLDLSIKGGYTSIRPLPLSLGTLLLPLVSRSTSTTSCSSLPMIGHMSCLTL